MSFESVPLSGFAPKRRQARWLTSCPRRYVAKRVNGARTVPCPPIALLDPEIRTGRASRRPPRPETKRLRTDSGIVKITAMAESQILLDNAHVEVSLLDGKVVRFVRKRSPGEKLTVLEVWGPVEQAVKDWPRASHALLVDMRTALGRNDAEFETSFEPIRKRLTAGWRAVALVVASTSGRLQVQRYAREDGLSLGVFEDADAALAWLKSR